VSNLYGNPHSTSPASQLTAQRIDDIRLRLLYFFKADPDEFDVVFVANATAGIKLIMDCFRSHEQGFWYGYHRDAHTSLVGMREAATDQRCFSTDEEVETWLDELPSQIPSTQRSGLFAYPVQSNMNGRRLPSEWCKRVRSATKQSGQRIYTLLDAAAFVSTSPLDLSNVDDAPDFVVMSLYKIFGFPDLGVLLVRKSAAEALATRDYFGGGTVDMVVCLREQWHAKKIDTIHDQLEDGTLPIHSILAVAHALDVHALLFGSLEAVSRHTAFLTQKLHSGLASFRHGNGQPVCKLYSDPPLTKARTGSQGPVIAFNILDKQREWVSNAEVEKLASIHNIQLRTGGLCNPGGVAHALGLAPWEMKKNFSAGQRCGNENDIMNRKPTGVLRVSLGAMSTIADVDAFLAFMNEFFVDNSIPPILPDHSIIRSDQRSFYVESLTIYPIKSCAGWMVPAGEAWPVRQEGLGWDREWCLVHQGTGMALNQKMHPRMALLRPCLDLKEGFLRVQLAGGRGEEITVPLSDNPALYIQSSPSRPKTAKVCGDTVNMRTYKSGVISSFFTAALGVPCQLARFPAAGSPLSATRHSKAHMQRFQMERTPRVPGAYPQPTASGPSMMTPILLSNESPILTISRSSLNRLNEQIKATGGKIAHPSVFRANILVAEDCGITSGSQQPYAEDQWAGMKIGRASFRVMGACRRCQMVCIDQNTAEKDQEPFATLAKTRRRDGKVFFGVHTCLAIDAGKGEATIKVGERVRPCYDEYAQ